MPKNVKNTTFPSLLDLIAPHSCRGCGLTGSILCDRCKKYILKNHQNLCPICKEPNKHGICHNHQNNLPPTFIIGERTELLGVLIHDYKYRSIRALKKPLAELLYHVLPTPNPNTIIIPLPTISKHIRSRGLDHTYLIAKNLAKLNSNYHVAKLLLRNKNTVQVGTDLKTRQSQASSAYALNPKYTINPSNTYILLDDVWTTGASLLSATKMLQQAGANHLQIAILALSRLN